MPQRLVILGNSAAALAALRAYRACGGEGEVTLVSREVCDAYSPVLTTYYLRGRLPVEKLFVCDGSFYEEMAVDRVFGRATALDACAQEVLLDDGHRLSYDSLLIATGASPRRLEGLDPEVAGEILYLRTIDDARRIRERAEQAAHVVVVGGGLVSLQVAASLALPGRRVTGIVSAGQILSQNIDAAAAGIVQRHIEGTADVSFQFGASVREIARAGDGYRLTLAGGGEIAADLVVVGKGVSPNLDFVDPGAIRVAQGILVDAHLRTTAPNVYAAGDVSEGANRLTGRSGPVPNWINACEQGRIAGMNLAGREAVFEGSFAENMTTLFGLPVASLGLTRIPEGSHDLSEVVRSNAGRNVYRKVVLRGERLLGALLVGDIEDAGVLRSAIASGGASGFSASDVVREGICQADRLMACIVGTREVGVGGRSPGI